MMKLIEIELVLLIRILKNNDVFPCEWLVCEKVFPVLGLDVQLVDGFVTEHVAAWFDARDVAVVVEYLSI